MTPVQQAGLSMDEAASPARCCPLERGPSGADDAGWLAQLTGPWWVLQTRAQSEKRVAGDLERQGCHHYLPLVRVQHTYTRCRRAVFYKPLFPGYIFLNGGYRDLEIAWRSRRVARVLAVPDPARLRRELLQIHRVVESNDGVELYRGLQQGRRCRIVSGPLRGVEGVVTQWCGRTRLYLSVSLIGQSATVEIDAGLLEAVA